MNQRSRAPATALAPWRPPRSPLCPGLPFPPAVRKSDWSCAHQGALYSPPPLGLGCRAGWPII